MHMHLQAFTIPLEVHNYALRQKAREELDQIQEIIERRKVELAERKVRAHLQHELAERAMQSSSSRAIVVHSFASLPIVSFLAGAE